jgi:2-oxoglutarate dehydrogenase E2 component (dihydrolipoamide succinyltransferase)
MPEDIAITVPAVGESISEVYIGEWYINEGTYVPADTNLVGLETEKATFDVPAPTGGVLTRVERQVGETAQIGETLGWLAPQDAPAENATAPAETPPQKQTESASPGPSPATPASGHVMPAAKRLMIENNLTTGSVTGSGPGGRVLKEDVAQHLQTASDRGAGSRATRSVPLSPMRQTIARRLVSAQQTAALLTTFNEIDMSAVKQLRATYKDAFQKQYGAKLGFMSFFVKAVVGALQRFPQVNAQIEDRSLVYHDYCDIGIAIGGGKGLLVPVLRNVENMSFADVELAILDFGARAKRNQISLEELQGGTFTITNGGVYGSLLSTPIVNPPQSGVLGMHGIVDRPVAVNGEVVIRPMMYVALTYDHRVVDGREAVSFLRHIGDMIEDPARMILEI